ncbi:putative ATP-dependent RNA helicase DDX10 [Orchesella cincta]|uniref:ATP-dependent RNA helicase n=1 Tax=Orchesella cincta TaxID=48709 RepID=A0A1D2N5J4_ORCCI|nr:putative ATP-dependent RNA helicase DDX10 [Orchesella cincta]
MGADAPKKKGGRGRSNRGGGGRPRYTKKDKTKFSGANDIPLGARAAPVVGEGDGNGSIFEETLQQGGKKQNLGGGQKRINDKKKKYEEVEFDPKSKKSMDEKKEIKKLNDVLENGPHLEPAQIKTFKDIPISKKTLLGLRDSEYKVPTDIQKESISLALRGMDILGAAKTGSGKTLAFVIPVIEKLYRNLWSKVDGLGAVIITPTRELAYQIFETLRKIGRYHDFSAGLIIGGKDLKFERKRMDQLNIVICTPGRLLQHMDENSSFITTNLQIIVLDEADRCLDMGFEKDMNAILDHLPNERQTLLFSATQTKSVKDLARLSLKSPVYVSVHENSQYSTPEALQQSYVVCPLDSKLNMLWSFLKHHKRSKILVFMSSCKQVRFAHMLFCRMRPGISLLALHGSMHQLKRMACYDEFCKKQAVALFATDIAARGLDFPAVDWVLQLDCPEDATTYIHRAGRTARLNQGGEALLVLLPSEETAMITQLQEKRIPIDKIEVNMKRMISVSRKFEALLARDLTLKECAQRAFKAYLKSVFLMKNKDVFDVSTLDLSSFARSLGLAVAPRVRFLQKRGVAQQATNSGSKSNSDQDSESEGDVEKIIEPTESSATFDFTVDDDEDMDSLFTGKKPAEIDDDDEDFQEPLTINENGSNAKPKKAKTKAAVAKKLIKKKIQINKKLVFDDEGDAVLDTRKEKRSELARNYELEDAAGIDVERAKLVLKEEDQFDKQLFRERVKAKHKEARRKAKLARKGLTEEEVEEQHDSNDVGATLGHEGDSDSDDYQPNLDWLPDPDKIYGSNDEFDSSEPESGYTDDDEDFHQRGKRQREVVNTDSESEEDEPPPKKANKLNKPNKSKQFTQSNKSMDKDLMEDLALQLLRGKR